MDKGMKFDWNDPRKQAQKPQQNASYSSEGLFAQGAKNKK